MRGERLFLREERVLAGEGHCELHMRGRRLFHNACPLGGTVHIPVLLPRRLGTCRLFCVITDDGGEVCRLAMRYRGISRGQDAYEAVYRPTRSGLFFFSFFGSGAQGEFFGMRAGAGRLFFTRRAEGVYFPLTVTDFRYPAPKWLHGGIIYHVFVDRFCRRGSSPLREGVLMHEDWAHGIPVYPPYPGGPLLNNDFFGGTLDGITEKLSDLVALGVNCLYLSPIFEAVSNHKYDTGNYEKIDPMLGGETAFFRLLAKARQRGIRVVLDGVFNHTGSDSMYFNKQGRYPTLGAYQSKDSPYYGWYTFHHYPDRYEAWWGIDTLPRLDHSAPGIREYFLGKQGVIARYASAGIAGLRLDVADELEDSFVEGVKDCLAEHVQDSVLFGEVWEDAALKISYGKRRRYYLGRELDGVMNYPLREGLIAYFRSGEVAPLRYALEEVLANMPPRMAAAAMNVLGTHDTVRVLTALVGADPCDYTMDELAAMSLSPQEYKRGREVLILAYLALCTLPGVPTVFYGDEVGMQGYADPLNRRPYPWHKRDRVLLSAYRRIGRMRRQETVFREGEMRLLHLEAELFVVCRMQGRRVVLTVINRGKRGLHVHFDRTVRSLLEKGSERCFFLPAVSGGVYRTVRGTRLLLFYDRGERVVLGR